MALLGIISKQFHREDPKQLRKELGWLWGRIRQNRMHVLTVGLLGLISAVMGLASSVASKYLIDAVTGYGAQMLARSALLMVGMMLGSLVFQAISSRIGAAIHVRMKNQLQHDTYTRILRAGWEALEPYRSGDLLNRLNTDVNVAADGIIHFFRHC